MNNLRHESEVMTEALAAKAVADANLLLARAKALAREKATATDAAADSIEVLEFGLSNETYAFELTHVREVLVLVELTPLPQLPRSTGKKVQRRKRSN